MKNSFKKLLQSICSLILASQIQLALADTASDSEIVFNWAENTYPELFPNHQPTQSFNPWIVRFYPETGIYIGVNTNDTILYLLGGPWDALTQVGPLSEIVNLARGNTGISACDTVDVPEGIVYSQSGNVVTISTNGQCVPMPDINDPINTNLCAIPQQSAATGISVLNSNTVTSSTIEGITIDSPINPFQSILESTANVQHCTINAAVETPNVTVNTDLCFDITALTASFPPVDGVTITPPINFRFAGTATNTIVADCFATNASTISNAFTGEIWVRNPATGELIPVAN